MATRKFFKSNRNNAFSLFGLEVIFIALIGMLFYAFKGWFASYSFILGSCISFLPTLYFIWRFFRTNRPSAARQIVRTFYLSELIKLLMMALLFIVIVMVVELEFWYFILGFLIAQMGIWLAPILFIKEYGVKNS